MTQSCKNEDMTIDDLEPLRYVAKITLKNNSNYFILLKFKCSTSYLILCLSLYAVINIISQRVILINYVKRENSLSRFENR